MRIKMKNTESGQYPGMRAFTGNDNDGFHLLAGHEYDVPDELGKAWEAKGICSKVRAKKEAKDEVREVVKNEVKTTAAKEMTDGN